MVQGSQAPGSCYRGGEAEEEKEAGYKVSGPTLEPPKARLTGTWWALHSRRPRGTTHGDTPHIPWPRPLPRPPDGLLRALGWMGKIPHAPGRVPGQVSHTPPPTVTAPCRCQDQRSSPEGMLQRVPTSPVSRWMEGRGQGRKGEEDDQAAVGRRDGSHSPCGR